MAEVDGSRRLIAVVAAAVLGLFGAACSRSSDRPVAVEDQPRTTPAPSSPISAEVPDDWELVTAGVGTSQQPWGKGTIERPVEPYTVVRQSDGDAIVRVGAVGYGGSDEGLASISLALPAGVPDELEVDDRRALLTPPDEIWQDDRADLPEGLVDLVVDVDGSSAVRALSTSATESELIEVASLARLDEDHRVAPYFEELPAGFEVVGSVDATGVQALQATLSPGTDLVPGDDLTHTLGWTVGPADALSPASPVVAVSAVPAGSISREAIDLAMPIWTSEGSVDLTEVDGRPAAEISEGISRWLIAETAWGDQLVVSNHSARTTDAPPPTFELLARIAASVRQARPESWEALAQEAAGGPGLSANVGRTEIARGEANGLEWLLQTGDGVDAYLGSFTIDSCLKLNNDGTACVTSAEGTSDDDGRPRAVAMGTLGPEDLPFAIMVLPSDDPAVELRYVKAGATIATRFHPVVIADSKAAVLIAEPGDRFECPDPGPGQGPGDGPEPAGPLERYDADGNPLGCLDF